ncbi:MAG: cytochrome P450 [Polyangiaceae bacterium]
MSTMSEAGLFGRLMSPECVSNPYAFYDDLRAARAVHVEGAAPLAIYTRHADVLAILQDKRFSSDWPSTYAFARPLTADEEPIFKRIVRFFGLWMQGNDGAKHLRLRNLVQRAFTPKMLQRMDREIAGIVDHLIAEMPSSGEVDFMTAFARPFPEYVIASMFGIDPAHRSKFANAANAVFNFLGVRDPAPGALKNVEDNLNLVRDFLLPLIEARRTSPTEDLISAFVTAEPDGDALSTEEIVVQCSMMLAAGHETTANLLGNGLLAFLKNPEQAARVRKDPALIKTAVEECLRFDSPSLFTVRLAAEDFEFGGLQLKRGQNVWLGLGPGNRDDSHFAEPNTFDVGRTPGKTLSLGWGAHYCLGAELSRMEGQAAFARILSDLEGLELAVDANELTYVPNFMLRALVSLPIRYRSKGASA